jgi:YVTN family beta-propeller protein
MWMLGWCMRVLGAVLWVLASGTSLWADVIVVANEHAGTLSILDTNGGTSTATLTVGGDPHNLAATTDGRKVLVTHPAAETVTIIDPHIPKAVKRLEIPGRPHGVAASPDGRWAFVGAEGGRRIHVVDLQRLEVDRSFAVEPAPHNLLVTHAGLLWITAHGARFLWLVDAQRGTLLSRLETSARPHDLALAANTLWVANWGSPDVFAVHGRHHQIESVRISGSQPHHVAITPDGREVWITNHGSGDISIIHAAARRELTRIRVGKDPHHVAFSTDGRLAYVANSGSNDVSVVDVLKRREMKRLPASAHPHGILVLRSAR